MFKLVVFVCLAAAVLGQRQFERRQIGQGQQFGQSRFGQPRQQFGQPHQQFGRQPFGQSQFGQPEFRQQQPFEQSQARPQQFGQQFQQPRQQLGQPLNQPQLDQPQLIQSLNQQLDQPQFAQPLGQPQLGQPQLGQPLTRDLGQTSPPVPILRQNNNQSPEGSFQYDYLSADSTEVEAQGEQRQIGDGVGTVMQGSYSYVAPNGELIEVRWIADENGFQPIVSRSPSQ